ncbi:hypothetical protein FIBSPDRAFT_980745 [Athelia psychrophila]|uniref:Uncharacterized protein n=1 Tax=Athelia psychrophila TaxID=1759441 RepID=A0A166TGJ1_9AGAM|nr:hypothetical protein FIBSPDRAFT_980745 [Fibularhizoctonia sp. CBS 109695]
MQTFLRFLNLVASSASASAAAIALYQPSSLSGSDNVQHGELFYARMYAARSIPLGLAFGVLPYWPGGVAVPWILFTAAVIQLVDVGIAMDKKDRGMMIGASIGAAIHVLCGMGELGHFGTDTSNF